MAGSWRDSLHWTRLSTTSLCSQFLRVWTWPCQQAPTVRLVSTSSWGEHVPLLLLAVLINRVARCLVPVLVSQEDEGRHHQPLHSVQLVDSQPGLARQYSLSLSLS